ncbi:hypothetical protein BRARA_E01468 [Brassica rapa]|uniref:Uncharacterized protein n=1 Tax=Brassica campestris TaxID=3711 RepID=A0A397Z9Q7_BRACM|nr:hypothetical protein BRARA_E01468 [Brassica rapa]
MIPCVLELNRIYTSLMKSQGPSSQALPSRHSIILRKPGYSVSSAERRKRLRPRIFLRLVLRRLNRERKMEGLVW